MIPQGYRNYKHIPELGFFGATGYYPEVRGNDESICFPALSSLFCVFLQRFRVAQAQAVIQSSSATTVMVVGFVNSGIMKLGNAIGLILGANIGTTATGWILTLAGAEGGGVFSSSSMFALIAFFGILLYFFL